MSDPLEKLWNDLLSREPELVVGAYQGLSNEEKEAVYEHLHRMATEGGWHPEQKQSASSALEAIDSWRAQSPDDRAMN